MSGGGSKTPLRVIAVVVFLFSVTVLSALTTVIWPGEAKLLAPILCDDAHPDAYVVSDTYSSGPGETSTNFTLYCVGPRGDHRDVGWFKPFLGITAINGIVIALVIALFVVRARIRRLRRRQAVTPPTDPGQPRDAGPASGARPTIDGLPPGIISIDDAVPRDDVS